MYCCIRGGSKTQKQRNPTIAKGGTTNTSLLKEIDEIQSYLISLSSFGSGRDQGMGRHAPREECPRHLMLQHTHTCNAARSGVVHTPTHGRTNFGSKAVPCSLPISSETIVCIWLSVLFCGLYSAATGGARVPILPCFRVPVKYLGVCVSSVRTEVWDSVLF